MSENDKLFAIRDGPHYCTYFLAKNKKEALTRYKRETHWDGGRMLSREERTDWKETFESLTDVHENVSAIIKPILEENGAVIMIRIPESVFKLPLWEKYFDGKFFWGRTLEEMQKLRDKRDVTKEFEKLKERLIKLGKYIEEGNVDAMV